MSPPPKDGDGIDGKFAALLSQQQGSRVPDESDGFVRLPPDQLAALERAMREGPMRVPSSGSSEVPTGLDATALRKTVVTLIDDELSRRRVLSDQEIRAIAKDVAHTVCEQALRPIQDKIRNHLTDEEIEARIERIVLEILRNIGLRADEAHADETRDAVQGVIRGYKRRNEFGKDFAKEIVKALATLGIGGFLAFVGTYIAIKGGGH